MAHSHARGSTRRQQCGRCFQRLAAVCRSWGDLGDEFYAALEQRAETIAVAALHGGACTTCGQALPHSSGMLHASDRAQEVLRSALRVSLPCITLSSSWARCTHEVFHSSGNC